MNFMDNWRSESTAKKAKSSLGLQPTYVVENITRSWQVGNRGNEKAFAPPQKEEQRISLLRDNEPC